MKFEQRVIIKIIDIEKEEMDIYDEDGLDFSLENDQINPFEQGFVIGFMSS
tara:strand:+ start:251 stop:403 length:153 start_codon:yes stop_codon:yes gene_type:complete